MGVKSAFRSRPFLAIAFMVAILVTVGFGTRLVMHAVMWKDRIQQDQPIEHWMTPKYVGHSWDVPKDVIVGALGLEPGGKRPLRLDDIAMERGVPVDDVISDLEAAIADFRARQP